MFTFFQICHFITCFVVLISLIVGLTRKDEKQIRVWHWVNRICLIIMAIGGIGMEIKVLPAQPVPAVIKCVLGFVTIFLMEKTFRYKENGTLNRNRVICVVAAYAVTVVCGLVLLKMTGGFGGL